MKTSIHLMNKYGKLPIHKWSVPSKSYPELSYKVSQFKEGRFECDCMFFLTKRVDCRHIGLIKASLNPDQLSLID